MHEWSIIRYEPNLENSFIKKKLLLNFAGQKTAFPHKGYVSWMIQCWECIKIGGFNWNAEKHVF